MRVRAGGHTSCDPAWKDTHPEDMHRNNDSLYARTQISAFLHRSPKWDALAAVSWQLLSQYEPNEQRSYSNTVEQLGKLIIVSVLHGRNSEKENGQSLWTNQTTETKHSTQCSYTQDTIKHTYKCTAHRILSLSCLNTSGRPVWFLVTNLAAFHCQMCILNGVVLILQSISEV